jgi:hypothetical protein
VTKSLLGVRVVGVLGEFIVSLQRRIWDGEGFQIGAAREIHWQEDAASQLAVAAGEDKSHGGKAWGVPVQSLAQGSGQFPGAVVIE